MLLQKYALRLAENSIYTTNLHHDASHLYRDAFAEVLGSGVVGTSPNKFDIFHPKPSEILAPPPPCLQLI